MIKCWMKLLIHSQTSTVVLWLNILIRELDCAGHLACLVSHYGEVIMGTIASQIISLTIVYSTVYSDADQRKQQSSPSLGFVWEFTGDR